MSILKNTLKNVSNWKKWFNKNSDQTTNAGDSTQSSSETKSQTTGFHEKVEFQSTTESYSSGTTQDSSDSYSTFNNIRYRWIEDEELLRDEAVIDGMAGCDGAEKVNAIRAYYKHLASKSLESLASIDDELKPLQEKKHGLENQKENIESEIKKIDAEIEILSMEKKGVFDRHGTRSLLALVAALLSVPVVRHFLTPAIGDTYIAWLIAGVALFAGSFMLWGATSVLHRSATPTPREKLLGWLEEFGAPLVATGVFVALLWNSLPKNMLIGVTLLFSLVFFMAGRSFLGNLFQGFAHWRENRNLNLKIKTLTKDRKRLAEKIPQIENDVKKIEEDVDKIRAKHHEETKKHRIVVENINNIAESRVLLYESERKRAETFMKFLEKNHEEVKPEFTANFKSQN